tara:strand:+ start:397 stop:561 length:165 start_codon:yes stop_codon:yes gene_type:complete
MSESDSEESVKPPPKAKKISFIKAAESEKSNTPAKKEKGSRSDSEKSAKSDKSS